MLASLDQMEKPTVYGDEGRLRAAVTRAINSAEDLLAQASGVPPGVGRLMEAAGDGWDKYAVEERWEAEFRGGFNRTGRSLHKYLRDQLVGTPRQVRAGVYPLLSVDGKLPTLAVGLPPDDGRHTIHLEEGEEWLRKTLAELRELNAVLARSRPATKPSLTTPARSTWVASWWKLGTARSIACRSSASRSPSPSLSASRLPAPAAARYAASKHAVLRVG